MRGGKTQIYSFNKKHLSIIFLIAVLITPTISFADADKIFKENSVKGNMSGLDMIHISKSDPQLPDLGHVSDAQLFGRV